MEKTAIDAELALLVTTLESLVPAAAAAYSAMFEIGGQAVMPLPLSCFPPPCQRTPESPESLFLSAQALVASARQAALRRSSSVGVVSREVDQIHTQASALSDRSTRQINVFELVAETRHRHLSAMASIHTGWDGNLLHESRVRQTAAQMSVLKSFNHLVSAVAEQSIALVSESLGQSQDR